MTDGQNDSLWIDMRDFNQLGVHAFGLFLAVDEFSSAVVGAGTGHAPCRPDPRNEKEEEQEEQSIRGLPQYSLPIVCADEMFLTRKLANGTFEKMKRAKVENDIFYETNAGG